MIRFQILLLLTSVLILFTSCEDNDIDNTPPEIEFISISPTPTEKTICGEVDPNAIDILGGQTIEFETLLKDDKALSQLKIDIHPNFDCHGHRSSNTSDWIILELIDLEGSQVEKKISMDVPEMVTAGFYHMQFRLVDKEGNSSPAGDFWNLYVRNPLDTIPPEILVLEPTSTNLSIKRGETLVFKINLSDNQPLNTGGNSRVELNYRRQNSDNVFTATQKIIDTSATNQLIDLEFKIPNTLVTGTYLFFINGYDGVNNIADRTEFMVEINE